MHQERRGPGRSPATHRAGGCPGAPQCTAPGRVDVAGRGRPSSPAAPSPPTRFLRLPPSRASAHGGTFRLSPSAGGRGRPEAAARGDPAATSPRGRPSLTPRAARPATNGRSPSAAPPAAGTAANSEPRRRAGPRRKPEPCGLRSGKGRGGAGRAAAA